LDFYCIITNVVFLPSLQAVVWQPSLPSLRYLQCFSVSR